MRFSASGLFRESNSPGPLLHYRNPFKIGLQFRRDSQLSRSFCTVDHGAELALALLATAQNFLKRVGHNVDWPCTKRQNMFPYGPMRKFWFSAMGHCGEFGSPLRATAKRFVLCYRAQPGMIDHSAESYELQFKACCNIRRDSWAKNRIFIKCTSKDLFHPCLKTFPA